MTSQGVDTLEVLSSTHYVTAHSEHVLINHKAIIPLCALLLNKGNIDTLAWEENYHFTEYNELTVAYIFILDTINFCFWGHPKWSITYDNQVLDGYWALAATLTREASHRPDFLDPNTLANLDVARLRRILKGNVEIPLFLERVLNLRELGEWVITDHKGKFSNIIRSVEFDGIRLAQLMATSLNSFKDQAIYKGNIVKFYKRAQILVADLYGAFQGQDWGNLKRMSELTAFADYKIPQILRHYGVLRFSEPLSTKVDRHIPLLAGSAEEIEIRANSIWGVELIRNELKRQGIDIPSYRLDWMLWLLSQTQEGMHPYHRTMTNFY